MRNLKLNVLIAAVCATAVSTVSGMCLTADAARPIARKQTAAFKHTVPTNVTGTYVLGSGDLANRLRVSQLKNGHIWFFLNAYYPYNDSTGAPSTNMGDAEGNIPLQSHIAVWKSPDGPGKLTFTFSNKQCTIAQDGDDFDCGFGHNVNASGVYRKISARVIPLKRKPAAQ